MHAQAPDYPGLANKNLVIGLIKSKYKLGSWADVWGRGPGPDPGLKQSAGGLGNTKTQTKGTANVSTITIINSQVRYQEPCYI